MSRRSSNRKALRTHIEKLENRRLLSGGWHGFGRGNSHEEAYESIIALITDIINERREEQTGIASDNLGDEGMVTGAQEFALADGLFDMGRQAGHKAMLSRQGRRGKCGEP